MAEYTYLNKERTQELINEIKTRLGTKNNVFQYTTLPDITQENDGLVVQYTGETTNEFTQGGFYVIDYTNNEYVQVTYGKEDIEELIAAGLKYKFVNELPTGSAIRNDTIYLVPADTTIENTFELKDVSDAAYSAALADTVRIAVVPIGNTETYYLIQSTNATATTWKIVSAIESTTIETGTLALDDVTGITNPVSGFVVDFAKTFGIDGTITASQVLEDATATTTSVDIKADEAKSIGIPQNYRNEYLYNEDVSDWELIGSSNMKLTDYVAKADMVAITAAQLSAMWED